MLKKIERKDAVNENNDLTRQRSSPKTLEALKSSLRSYFNLASRAIRKTQFTQNLVA
jgi:hypothetical protein